VGEHAGDWGDREPLPRRHHRRIGGTLAKDIRIGFEEAVGEKRLLKPWFVQLSKFQQTWLKVMYGCNLDGREQDDRGFTELDYWAASQDSGEWDEYGYLRSVTPVPYTPKQYKEAWGVCGIRAGKTDRFGSTITAYEAICGGHEAFVREGRPIICFQIAQDIRMAKYSLTSIHQTLKSMAFLKYGTTQSWIKNITADRIDLKNGVTITVTPPTVKSIRGYDSPIAVLDEVGVWYQDADSANPDFEIYDQVDSRQAQFENPKIVGISSPWNKAGLLFKRFEAGTEGSKIYCIECRTHGRRPDCEACAKERLPHHNRLVLYSSTAASNPIIPRAWLVQKYNKDPRAFARECLARFQDSLSGFLNAALIEKARTVGVMHRPPDKKFFYVAAIDPAFRQDAFGFTIVHCDPTEGVVQDLVRRWHDPTGTPLNPAEIFPQIASILAEYNVRSVFSDQHSFEALHYIAQQHGFGIQECTFSAQSKADIYGNLQQLLNQGKLRLLDDADTINELKALEKEVLQAGNVRIGAPQGQYDDMATVIAIAAHEAVWMLPREEKKVEKPKTMIQRHIEHVAATRRRTIRDNEMDW
jgi:hypothetical protein